VSTSPERALVPRGLYRLRLDKLLHPTDQAVIGRNCSAFANYDSTMVYV
jgi:hypothetical protein